ncbi:ankyrin repeat-containing domain protein [Mycena rebaudengoi]|nr:ankyrin repeat-containing domain protein [Mycena rebaudengoi]
MNALAACPVADIPSNPDITGIGVRAAIYLQSLLCFIPAIRALLHRQVSFYELKTILLQSPPIMITAFAILISAIAQAATLGLSGFHVNIILSLSWMNSTNMFMYFLLYIQHKSPPAPLRIGINPIPLLKHFLFMRPILDLNWIRDTGQDGKSRFQHQYIARLVPALGSLHLSMMAGLGFWLWSNPHSFGTGDSCVIDVASTVILGTRVPLRSSQLRAGSITLYSPFLVPGINLTIPLAFFLGMFFAAQTWARHKGPNATLGSQWRSPNVTSIIQFHPTDPSLTSVHLPPSPPTLVHLRPTTPTPVHLRPTTPPSPELHTSHYQHRSSILPLILGIVILFAINVIFLVDIELTLRQNRAPHTSIDEFTWTFGQTFVLILALGSLLKTIIAPVLVRYLRGLNHRKTIKREHNEEKELPVNQREHSEEHTESLRTALKEADMDEILECVKKGADVNVTTDGCEYATALQLASFLRDTYSVTMLLDCGADPNIKGGTDGVALRAAVCGGSWDVVRLLLENGADPDVQGGVPGMDLSLYEACANGEVKIVELLLVKGADPDIRGGKYWTSLQAASFEGETDIVKLLLAATADPNILGGQYGTALQAASTEGETEIVRLLLKNNADPNILGGKYGTALQAASLAGANVIAQLLLDHNADPNIFGGEYGTALQAASFAGELAIVKLLLQNGVHANLLTGKYGTALQAASFRGVTSIVRLLLENAADPNLLGGEYGTALHAASFTGELEIAKLLLDHGADPNIPDGTFGTALQAASREGESDIVKLLLEYGADPNLLALQAAGDREPVMVLLEHGADPNIIAGGTFGIGTAHQAEFPQGEASTSTLGLRPTRRKPAY